MILSCNNISKSFGTDVIIKSCSFNIEDHEKAAIVGINGAGKSTLLKIITGIEPADTGLVTLAKDKTLGYLSQQQNLNSDNTIYDELLSVKQYILDMEAQLRSIENQMKSADDTALETLMKKYSDLNHEFELNNGYAYKSEITGVLKGLGFAEEDFTLNVNTLSGGQKTRVALGRLLLSKPDIILLDEPTNHLDMESISWLENYLLNYSGAVLIVAHDRYFLDRIVRRIFAFEGNGVISQYEGGYTDYINKKKQQKVAGNAGTLREKNTGKSGSGSGAVQSANIGNAKSTGSIKGNGNQNTGEASNSQKKDDYKHRNKKLKFSYNEQREYETIEDDIANLEEKLGSLDKEMNENATNSVKLKELMETKEETENLLMEKMDRWEYLEDLAKRIAEQ